MKWYHKSIYCEKLLSWVSLGTSLQEPQGLQPQTLTSWLPSIWNLTRVLSPLRLLCLPYRRLYLGMQQICVCFFNPIPCFLLEFRKSRTMQMGIHMSLSISLSGYSVTYPNVDCWLGWLASTGRDHGYCFGDPLSGTISQSVGYFLKASK